MFLSVKTQVTTWRSSSCSLLPPPWRWPIQRQLKRRCWRKKAWGNHQVFLHISVKRLLVTIPAWMMVLKHGILHLYPDTFDIKDLSCNNADSITTVIIVTLHNHQDLIVRPSISDTRNIYVCLHWFTYDYLLAHMQACVFIHYIHIALPTVRLPWPFCRKSTNFRQVWPC